MSLTPNEPLRMVFEPPNPSVQLGSSKLRKIKLARFLILSLATASLATTISIFVFNGGFQQLGDLAAILYATTRLAALLATNLLLIDILLVARVSWLESIFGHDRLVRTHKLLGKPILYLALLHVIAAVSQFAIGSGASLIDEFIVMVTFTPDLITAAFALGFMIVVVLTSLNISRKRVAYEVWHMLHLFAYAAVLLAIPHQFSLGSDVSNDGFANYYWMALYVFVLANIVWFRILKPVLRAATSLLRVERVERTSSDSVSIYLTAKNLKRYSAAAGQFFVFRPLTANQWYKPHPFSMSAASNPKHVRFTVASRGDDTEQIQGIKPGTVVLLEGPYGIFTESRRTQKDVVLIASGIGIPPIRALAESIAADPGDVTIIYRVRSENDAALLDETRELAHARGFKLVIQAGNRASANSWMNAGTEGATDLERLLEIAPNLAESDVYVCGPTAWTKAVERTLKKAGTPAKQVHTEQYAW